MAHSWRLLFGPLLLACVQGATLDGNAEQTPSGKTKAKSNAAPPEIVDKDGVKVFITDEKFEEILSNLEEKQTRLDNEILEDTKQLDELKKNHKNMKAAEYRSVSKELHEGLRKKKHELSLAKEQVKDVEHFRLKQHDPSYNRRYEAWNEKRRERHNALSHDILAEDVGIITEGSSYCFAGDTGVQVRGVGPTLMRDLRIGSEVLVEQRPGKLGYEPLLGFLHALPGRPGFAAASVRVEHATGTLRLSGNHIVFVATHGGGREAKLAGELQEGDQLLLAAEDGAPTPVLGIRQEYTKEGMFAPLTGSGTVVVDGVIASIYGTPDLAFKLPHPAAHAFALPLRMAGRVATRLFGHKFLQKEAPAEISAYTSLVWSAAKRLALF